MVDDFQVPDDPDYQYDVGSGTGADNALTLDYLAPVLPRFDAVFMPIDSRHETGTKTGSVMLSTAPGITAVLAELPTLRRWRRP